MGVARKKSSRGSQQVVVELSDDALRSALREARAAARALRAAECAARDAWYAAKHS